MSEWLTMVALTTRMAELAATVGLDVAEVSLKIKFRLAVGCGGGRSLAGFFFFLCDTVVNPASASTLAEVAVLAAVPVAFLLSLGVRGWVEFMGGVIAQAYSPPQQLLG
jgi:hypothetical protein